MHNNNNMYAYVRVLHVQYFSTCTSIVQNSDQRGFSACKYYFGVPSFYLFNKIE